MNDKIKNIAKIILLSVVPMMASCEKNKSEQPDKPKAVDARADFALIQVGRVGDSEQKNVPVNNIQECFDATLEVANEKKRRTVGFCYQWKKNTEGKEYDKMVGSVVKGSKYDQNSSDIECINSWAEPIPEN